MVLTLITAVATIAGFADSTINLRLQTRANAVLAVAPIGTDLRIARDLVARLSWRSGERRLHRVIDEKR